MSKNVYLVPHDFTAVGDAALRYALFLGKRVNTEIILLNLTTSKGESIKASMKFDDLIEKTDAPPSVSFRKVVREGNIFEDIGKKTDIKTGKSYEGKVEVLSGLKVGDKVITAGAQNLNDDDAVKF